MNKTFILILFSINIIFFVNPRFAYANIENTLQITNEDFYNILISHMRPNPISEDPRERINDFPGVLDFTLSYLYYASRLEGSDLSHSLKVLAKWEAPSFVTLGSGFKTGYAGSEKILNFELTLLAGIRISLPETEDYYPEIQFNVYGNRGKNLQNNNPNSTSTFGQSFTLYSGSVTGELILLLSQLQIKLVHTQFWYDSFFVDRMGPNNSTTYLARLEGLPVNNFASLPKLRSAVEILFQSDDDYSILLYGGRVQTFVAELYSNTYGLNFSTSVNNEWDVTYGLGRLDSQERGATTNVSLGFNYTY